MKPKSTLRSFLLLAGSPLLAASSLHAATLYWDGGTPAGPPGGGAGVWQTAGSWDTLPNADTSSNWVNGNTAFFGGTAGTVTIDTGGVTVDGLFFETTAYTITAGTNGLNFGPGINTILLNDVAAATISGTVGGAGNVVLSRNTNGGTLTLSGTSAGGWSGTTTNNSDMTLLLSGLNQGLLSTSGITLNGGGITLSNADNDAEDDLNRVNDAAAITSNGGTITYTNAVAGSARNFVETLGSVALTAGQLNLFNTLNKSAGSQTLVLSGLTRPGATSAITFSNAGDLNLTNDRIRVNGITTDTATDQIIGSWATTGTSATSQSDYAVYDSDGTDGYVLARNIPASDESLWSTVTSNYTLANTSGSAANGRLEGTRNINSLRNTTASTAVTASNAADTINLVGHTFAAGDVVVLGGTTVPTGLTFGVPYYVVNPVADAFQVAAAPGGLPLLFTTDGATLNITGGLTLPSGFNLGTTGILNGSGASLAIGGNGGSVTLPTTSAGSLHVTSGIGPISIAAPVTDNTGALTLVKNGNNTLTLSGSNTFTGGLVNNSGTTTLSGTNTFGSGAVTINGGQVTFSNIASWGGTGRNVTFGGNGALVSSVDGYSGGTLTVNPGAVAVIGVAGGIPSANISFASTTGSGTLVAGPNQNKLVNIGDASSFTGTLQGRMALNNTHGTNVSLQFSGLADTPGSALQFVQGSGPVNNDSGLDFTIAYNGTSALTFNNRQVQIFDRLAGNWEIENNGLSNNSSNPLHTWVINTDLLYLGGRASGVPQTGRILNLGGSNTGDNAFNGKISDGVVAGTAFNVAKSGNGRWILSGSNTYTGSTTISAGTLVGIGANAFGSTTGITTSGAPTLSLRGDSSTSFVKASDSTPYTLTTSTTGVTLNVDQATIAGTAAKTMTFGDITTSSTAATYQFNFTGANNTSLSAGTLSTSVSTGAAVHTINNTITGGGSLTLASVFNRATTVASPNLVFAGTGTTVITGAITQTLADTDLIKNDAGTLQLNGVNTYTGLTSVNAGTLGGTGTIAGSVTVAAPASLAPGVTVGTLSIGGGLDISLPVDGGAGKLNFDLGSLASSDKIAVTGTVTIGDGKLAFSDFVFNPLVGLQNGSYKLITSGVPISGTLDVPANLTGPVGAGTGTLQITGNDIELVVSGVAAGTPYDTWSGGASFGGDANNDGVSNGLAFLLGAAGPTDPIPARTVSQSGGGLIMTFSSRNDASRGTATLVLQHSGDLGIGDPWTTVPVTNTSSGPTSGVTFTVTPGSPNNTVTATISSSEAIGNKLFGRFRATP